MFDFTIHWMKGAITHKMGTCCLLRRSFNGSSILVWLILSAKILGVTADALTQFLHYYSVNLRKNTTKATKIRALLKLPQVISECSREKLDAIEALLVAAEEKRCKKNATEEPEEEHDKEEAACWPHKQTFMCLPSQANLQKH